MSIDGYIQDASDTRLLLSNDADFDRVDAVRAGCDAILVGANTIRQDNPRLLVRSAARRDDRVARGLPPSPAKVTVTAHGDLDPAAAEAHLVVAPFFVGDSRAPRFVGDGAFPWHSGHRATLAEVRQIGDVVLLRYGLSDRYGTG